MWDFFREIFFGRLKMVIQSIFSTIFIFHTCIATKILYNSGPNWIPVCNNETSSPLTILNLTTSYTIEIEFTLTAKQSSSSATIVSIGEWWTRTDGPEYTFLPWVNVGNVVNQGMGHFLYEKSYGISTNYSRVKYYRDERFLVDEVYSVRIDLVGIHGDETNQITYYINNEMIAIVKSGQYCHIEDNSSKDVPWYSYCQFSGEIEVEKMFNQPLYVGDGLKGNFCSDYFVRNILVYET